MKNLKLALLTILFPLFISAQQLSGFWTGKLTNDSTTERKDQSYELALTEYRGKVYGYSYTTFIIEDTLYYIVKRVKGKIDGGVCEVVDDEIVAHNFFKRLDKGVKVTQTFRMNKADSTWYIDGNWKTPETKKYYALTGSLSLKSEKDFDKSKLLQHLGDLQLDKNLSFYQPEKKVYLAAPRRTSVRKEDPVITKADPNKRKPGSMASIGELEIKNPEPVVKKEAEPEVKLLKPDSAAAVIAKTEQQNKKPAAIGSSKIAVAVNNDYEVRKKNLIQTVEYKTDSLVLSLYDNGEIDGDTVSVFMNGEILMEKQGLKSTAFKKTIYLKQGEEVEIILFADNLGRYPPNTGLLIIRDGEDRYEIRFSADFEQSAAIILRRKKN
jgi:hypothetical protein